jgi:formylglycine-generating enzyme required for sulfatase activity
VDDDQISKIGKNMGVHYVCVVKVAVSGAQKEHFISSRLIDVETAELTTSSRPTRIDVNDWDAIEKSCESVTASLFGEKGSGNRGSGSSVSGNNRVNTQRHPAEPEMVFVQGGTFWMGCTSEQQGACYDDEKPVHEVTLSNFYIGKYEVTQAQWEALMGNNSSRFKGSNLPVEQVSWDDAQMFIERLNAATGKRYRLPTEAEWEYAARGGNKSKGNKYSGSNFVENVAWMETNSGNATHPVGTKMANELGIYDMSGNVWEWCYDWYGAYPASAQNNPVGASSRSYRVNRGDSWSGSAGYCRVANRSLNSPGSSYGNLGFRLACSSE